MKPKSDDSPCILHLSDLQFGRLFLGTEANGQKKSDFQTSLLSSLKSFEKRKNAKINLVVITGDLASEGKTKDFDELGSFLKEIMKVLSLSEENIILIPGNHDMDWDVALKDKNNQFSDYIQFCDTFFGDSENYIKGKENLLRIVPEYELLFGCFNSAKKIEVVMKDGRKQVLEETNHGLIDSQQLDTFFSELNNVGVNYTRIALFHHFPVPISEDDHAYIKNWYAFHNKLLEWNFQIGLCGHIHKSASFSQSDLESTINVFSAGSISVKGDQLPTATAYSCNILQIQKGGNSVLHVLQYDTQSSRWSPLKELNFQISPIQKSGTTSLKNPFAHTSAEVMLNNLLDFFVEEPSYIQTLESRNSCFIYGRRGSGKSMNLHYMKINNRIKEIDKSTFFTRDNVKEAYIGILFPCKGGMFTKYQFDHLTKYQKVPESFAWKICEYYTVMILFSAVINTFLENFRDELVKVEIKKQDFSSITNDVIQSIIRGAVGDTLLNCLQKIQEKLHLDEIEYRSYFHQCYKQMGSCSLSDPPIYEFNELIAFIKWIKSLFEPFDFVIYLLLDDADELYEYQKECINGWILRRENSNVCFKIALKNKENWNFSSKSGQIQENHDFITLHMDKLYSYPYKKPYYNKIGKMCEKRLRFFGYSMKIQDMFPPNQTIKEDRQQKKIEFYKSYSENIEAEQDEKVKKSKIRNRYTNFLSFYYNYLGKSKQSPDYTGYDNIVHLSSGNPRQFLELCYEIYSAASQEHNKLDTKMYVIDPAIQREVIKKFCTEKFLTLDKNIRDNERRNKTLSTQYQKLRSLIQNLGQRFNEILKAKEHPSVKFSFQYIGENRNLQSVIQLGVNDDYFQQYYYASSERGRQISTHSLNKAIAAHFGLHIRSYSGTIIIQDDLMRDLCTRTSLDSFLRKELDDNEQEGDVLEYEEDFEEEDE